METFCSYIFCFSFTDVNSMELRDNFADIVFM